jgi:hypothetical protein
MIKNRIESRNRGKTKPSLKKRRPNNIKGVELTKKHNTLTNGRFSSEILNIKSGIGNSPTIPGIRRKK